MDGCSCWQRVLDTIDPYARDAAFEPGGRYPLQGRSVAVFKLAIPRPERRRSSQPVRKTEELALTEG